MNIDNESQALPISVSEGRQGRQGSNRKTLWLRTLEELLADASLTATAWLVDGLIPLGGLTILHGLGKTGKTTLLTHLAGAIVKGSPFLEREVRKGPVVWLDLEQHLALTVRKLAGAGASEQPHLVYIHNGVAPDLREVVDAVRKNGAVAVVVDSLSTLLRLQDENAAAEVTTKVSPLLRLARDTNTAVIAIHHDRKREGAGAGSMRGSSVFLNAADVVMGLKADGGHQDCTRRLECTGRYDEARGTLSVRLTKGGYVLLGERETVEADRVLEALGNASLTAEQLAAKLECSRAPVVKRLNELVEDGRITKEGGGIRGDPYRYCKARVSEIATAPVADSETAMAK